MSKNLSIESWGTLTKIDSDNTKAKVLIGKPEIHRLLKTLRENEKKKSNPKSEIVEALQLLESHFFNSSLDTIEAEVPVDKRINL